MQADFVITEHDLKAAVSEVYHVQTPFLKRHFVGLIVPLVVIGDILFDYAKGDMSREKVISGIVFIAGWVLIYAVLLVPNPGKTLKSALKKNGHRFYLGKMSCSILDDVLTWNQDYYSARYNWSVFHTVVEFENGIALVIGSYTVVLISKNSFESQISFDDFADQIRVKIEQAKSWEVPGK